MQQQIKSRRGLVSVLTLAAIMFLALANSSNPPNGRTGAPGDGLCSDCHGQNNPPQDGDIEIDGLPASIVPNSVYTLTVTVSNPNSLAVRAGFQMTILNSGNQIAGALSNPSGSSTVTPSGGREYHEHNPAKNFGAGTEVSWTVDWTSPSGPDMEQITAYAAGIVANGVGGNSGDLLVTSTESGSMSGSALTIEVVSDPVSCFGGDDGAAAVNASGGTPGYSYMWSTGGNTQQINGLTAGTYSVTVSDSQGSTAEGEVDVEQPEAVGAELTLIQPPLCTGESNGSITAQGSGGTPGYTYSWSNGGSGNVVENLSAGPYSVTVTDANGCTSEASTTLTDPDALVVELVGSVDPSCEGAADGIIEVVAGGGTAPFTYIWSNGATGSTIDQLPEDTYTVTVTDFNGCSVEDTYVLVAGASTIEITSVTVQDVSCAGGADGSITIEGTGQGPLQFNWQDGGTGNERLNLSAGTYSVTVSDGSGCTLAASYQVSEASPIVVVVSGDASVSCFGDMDANVTATATGGTPPYMFEWSDGGDGTGLGAGTYTVTVTDANGCTSSGQFTITQPTVLAANASATDETAVDAADGTAKSEPTGGTVPYSYAWTTGAATDSIGNLPPGDYTVTVTDANGCTATQTVTVNTFGCELTIAVESSDASCYAFDDGTAEVSWTGASGDVDIVWSNGDTTAVIQGLAPGSYNVTVTDTSGCVAQANVMINEPDQLMFEVVFDSVVCEGEQVTIMVTPPDFSEYIWSDGQTGQTITVLPDDYCVTVVDESGCIADTCISIGVSPPITIMVDSVLDSNAGADDGEIYITTEGGTLPLVYMWMDLTGELVSTDEDPTGLPTGVYLVVVVDALGCETVSDMVTVGVISSTENVAEEIGLNVFPNPASEQIEIQVGSEVMVDKMVIYNGGGTKMSSYFMKRHFTKKLDISEFPAGVYFIAIQTDKGVAVQRFLKL